MRKNTILKLILWLLILIFTGTNAVAEDRYEPYEMVDGNTVWFKMTPKAIAAENAEQARLPASRQAAVKEPEKWVETFELPESGIILTFPMSAEKIQSAQREARQKAARKEAVRSARSDKNADIETSIVEMVDGNTIVFTRNKGKESAESDSWLSKIFRSIYS